MPTHASPDDNRASTSELPATSPGTDSPLPKGGGCRAEDEGKDQEVGASSPSTLHPPPSTPVAKMRLRFRKAGALRLLGHHDLMRTFERMLRRAALPVSQTRGFHPKPRLVFALSLPLGVIGCEEVAELELDEVLSPEEVQERLTRQAPPGLTILSVRQIEISAGAQVRRLCYALTVPADRLPGLGERLSEVLATSECKVESIRAHVQGAGPGRAGPTRGLRDIRPFLRDLRLVAGPTEDGEGWRVEGGGGRPSSPSTLHPPPSTTLEMDLWLTPSGTARPDEVLTLLGLQELLAAGCVLERTRLELFDETPPETAKGSHEKRDAD